MPNLKPSNGRPRRHDGPTDVLTAMTVLTLKELGFSSQRITEQTRCKPRTQRDILAGRHGWHVLHTDAWARERIDEAKDRLARKALVVADAAFDRLLRAILDPDKKFSGMELNAIPATYIDKMLLLTGHPTQLHLHQHEIIRQEMQSREHFIRRLADLGILREVLDVTPEPPKEEPHGNPGS